MCDCMHEEQRTTFRSQFSPVCELQRLKKPSDLVEVTLQSELSCLTQKPKTMQFSSRGRYFQG